MLILLLMAGADEIILKNELEPKDVKIIKISQLEIEFTDDVSPVIQTMLTKHINFLTRDDVTANFRSALDYYIRQKYGDAYKAFFALRKQKPASRDDWMMEQMDFFIPMCLYKIVEDNPKIEAAEKYLVTAQDDLRKFITEHSKSWLQPRARYELGRVLLLLKKYEEANKLFAALADDPALGIADMASFGLVLVAKEQGQDDEALSICLKMLKGGKGNRELAEMASELILYNKKDYAQAKKLSEELLKDRNEELHESAYLLAGMAAFYLKNPEETFHNLLRAELIYGEGKTPSQMHLMVMAYTINQLMTDHPDQYPEWEYKRHYGNYFNKISEANKKKFKKFKP